MIAGPEEAAVLANGERAECQVAEASLVHGRRFFVFNWGNGVDSLIDFCSDPQLADLLELSKRGTDLLDLLNPRENQHSDLLAWCFNSREGHGQGDAILKDFLLAIYRATTESSPGDLLAGNGLTKRFVNEWPPTRTLTSSLATACFYREYCLSDDCSQAKRRIDLLVIDTQNRFLVVVENKVGARVRRNQLEGYIDGIRESLLSKPAFAGFAVAFVLLDKNHDPEADPSDELDPRWAVLDYEWLEPAAKRAEMALNRGNQDAALILAYCRKQTGWEPEEVKKVTRLARELAIRYPEVVKHLEKTVEERDDPVSWTPTLLTGSSPEGQLLRLLLQNRKACKALVNLPPIELLHGTLCDEMPYLDQEEHLDKARVVVSYRPRVDLPMSDDWWPLFVRVRQTNAGRSTEPEFTVKLIWRPRHVAEAFRAAVSQMIHADFPAAKRVSHKGVALEQITGADFATAVKAVKQMLTRCERLGFNPQTAVSSLGT